MVNHLIQNIVEYFRNFQEDVLLVENNDGFLFRDDVIQELRKSFILICKGKLIKQRVFYELKKKDTVLVLLSEDNSVYLEDIKEKAFSFEFFLEDYLGSYHIPSIASADLEILNILYANKPVISLSKQETVKEVNKVKKLVNEKDKSDFNYYLFISGVDKEMENSSVKWKNVAVFLSSAILKSIGTSRYHDVINKVNEINERFQAELKHSFKQTINSNAVKRPEIVSKILDYLSFNYLDDKLALIVIDGMAYWQYEMLKSKLPGFKQENTIFSWIPSITQLSRQAIFRGDVPLNEYRQNPVNESKLWYSYWRDKGLKDYQIEYMHEDTDLDRLYSVTKLAMVFKDLDEKMHSSSDYKDLSDLTKNWIERSNVVDVIKELLSKGYKIFLTTDHGNIQARGWRNLHGRERLGTNKSGSKSQRHLEYSEKWLQEEFIDNNPEIKSALVQEDKALYFKNDQSFSTKDTLVTHGGSHILEVLIPFIKILDEK